MHNPPRVDIAEGLLRVCPPGCIALTRAERLACAPYSVTTGTSDFLVSPTSETFAGTFSLAEDVTSARVWLMTPDALYKRLPGRQGRNSRIACHPGLPLASSRQSVVSVLRGRMSNAGTVLWRQGDSDDTECAGSSRHSLAF